jgi:hypothetical protein
MEVYPNQSLQDKRSKELVPGATALEHEEDGVEDLAGVVEPRAPVTVGEGM